MRFLPLLLFEADDGGGQGIPDGDDVPSDVDKALALVLIHAVVHDEFSHEVADEGIAAKGAHVRPGDGEDLAQKGLDETVEPANL